VQGKSNLLKIGASEIVTLSSSNTYSYEKVTMPLKDYIDYMTEEETNPNRANESYYMFGNNYEGMTFLNLSEDI